MKPIEIDGRIGVTAILLSAGESLVAILWLRSIALYVVCIATHICIGQFTRAKHRMPNNGGQSRREAAYPGSSCSQSGLEVQR